MAKEQDHRENLDSRHQDGEYLKLWRRLAAAEAEHAFPALTNGRFCGVKLLTANYLLAQQRYFCKALGGYEDLFPAVDLGRRLIDAVIRTH